MTTQDTPHDQHAITFAMSSPEAGGPEAGAVVPPAGVPSEDGGASAGGAGMAEEGAPAGFTADVAGGTASTDDPDEARALVVDAAKAGPRSTAEQTEAQSDGDQQDADH